MKILHTSDWHLGQKYLYYDREEEHRLALHWLIDTIHTQEVEVLIVAGDVFDIGNPPNYARRLYYNFLTALLKSPCRHIVITGGNHDSPSMLDAPKELLAALNMHVVGTASKNLEDELIQLKDKNGKVEAVVAAVPFLRDSDLRFSVAGESGYERIGRVREGILRHYQNIGTLAENFKNAAIPILATGHLYVKGAFASDKQDNIYIGDVENIDPTHFPDIFKYIALGHIHRAQAISGLEHIRYSGSLIPLSFSETKDEKCVKLLEFKKGHLTSVEALCLPTFRRLKTIEGTLQEIEAGLMRFDSKGGRELTPWVEIILHSDRVIPQLDMQLKDFTKDMNLELLKLRLHHSHFALDMQTEEISLKSLDEMEVFTKKCESAGKEPDDMQELVATFRELQEWMEERGDGAIG